MLQWACCACSSCGIDSVCFNVTTTPVLYPSTVVSGHYGWILCWLALADGDRLSAAKAVMPRMTGIDWLMHLTRHV